MMNVLILDDAGFGLEGGRGIYGKEIYSEVLANINLKLGNTVVRAVLGTGSSSNVDVLTVKGSKLPVVRTFYDKPLMHGLLKLCRDNKIDLIHANILNARYPFALSKVSRQLKLPLVITVHSWVYLCPTNYNVMLPKLTPCEKSPSKIACMKCMNAKAKMTSMFPPLAASKMMHQTYTLKSLLKAADCIISPLNAFTAKLHESLNVNSYYIPNPLNPKLLEETAESDGDGSILFMGRLEQEKGVHLLQPLASHLSKTNIHVIGRGTLELTFQKEKSPNIVYHGFVTEAEKRDLIKKASVVIIPSVWCEMFGYTVSEAFSLGKPVVAFNLGGPKEQIDASGGGLLAKPFVVEDFAEKVTYLLENPSEAKEMGAKGRQWAEDKLSPDNYANSLEIAYEKAMIPMNSIVS